MIVHSKKLALIGLVGLLIIAAIVSCWLTLTLIVKKQEVILPKGVYVGEINVAGMSVAQALEVVKDNTAFLDQKLQLIWPSGSYSLEVAKLKPEIDFKRLEAKLIKTLPSGNFFERRAYKKQLLIDERHLNLPVRTEEEEFNNLVTVLDQKISRQPEDAAFVVDVLDRISIAKEKNGLKVDYPKLLSDLPQKLYLGATEYKVPIIIIQPSLKEEELVTWGIKEVLVEFYTRFDTQKTNRVENLKLAARALDGIILKPGEEFSFNAWVGPRIRELGYKDAPTLIDGELTEDVGGGVCQVSSTLYNVALLSGFEIIERTHHSAPVSYVSPGRDAAVAFDYLDLRFRNTQVNYVLITTRVLGDRLWCKLFGSPQPEKIFISTENIKEIPFETQKGAYTREGKPGLTVETYVVKGNKKELVSKDYYKPRPAIIP